MGALLYFKTWRFIRRFAMKLLIYCTIQFNYYYFYFILQTIATIQIVAGTLLVCLGIVAIVLLAHWSYFAVPIWAGILVGTPTALYSDKRKQLTDHPNQRKCGF